MKSFLLVLSLAVVSTAFVACGGDSDNAESACNDACKEAKSCNDDSNSEIDCSECGSLNAIVKDTGCEDELAGFYNCVTDNVCKDDLSGDECDSELDKAEKCSDDFCADHTSDSRCTSTQSTSTRGRVFSYSPGFRF